ncbi:MAG: thioredoxin domain-containing protein [Bryobacteraceae bacterium]
MTARRAFELESFVQRWYHLAPGRTFKLIDSSSVASDCYRKLIFRANFPAPLLMLYLTPDGKHLVSELMDLRVDPAVAQQRIQEQLNARLVSGALLTSGKNTAPFTLVVFSDFECPYCRRFAEIFNRLTPQERSRVRIVYRQFPLKMHPWARDAAELTDCVALQNKGAFWKLHNFIFANQQEISKESFQTKALDFLARSTAVDPKAVLSCMRKKRFEVPLSEDKQLAIDLGIRGTPSVFVNGRRTVVRSIGDLQAALHIASSENAGAGSR